MWEVTSVTARTADLQLTSTPLDIVVLTYCQSGEWISCHTWTYCAVFHEVWYYVRLETVQVTKARAQPRRDLVALTLSYMYTGDTAGGGQWRVLPPARSWGTSPLAVNIKGRDDSSRHCPPQHNGGGLSPNHKHRGKTFPPTVNTGGGVD